MKGFQVYQDIRKRTNGEIYFGVVGPMRTGKSTFIRRFMELMVLSDMEEGPMKERTRDELPLAGSGTQIMTTEPKFVPAEAARVMLEDGIEIKLRLIDCVGFLVSDERKEREEQNKRLVHTPWSEDELPFEQAAELGTQKVIKEHSTIGIVITTDGSIGELSRVSYEQAEERTIQELKQIGKPFLVLLNSRNPSEKQTLQLAEQIRKKYDVCVLPMDCANLKTEDIKEMLQNLLYEFPACEIRFQIPEWMQVLSIEHTVKKDIVDLAMTLLKQIKHMKDALRCIKEVENPYLKTITVEEMDLANGKLTIVFLMKPDIYFQVMSEYAGFMIKSERQLLDVLKEYAQIAKRYAGVNDAMQEACEQGYGVVMPERDRIRLEEPQMIKHGNRYGVKMKASAPSVHMIRSMVETEIAPIVGSEEQAKDLIGYITDHASTRPDGIWETNIFGKSIEQIVEDGIHAKINQMTEECKQKLQDAMGKIINDSNGGIICIII